MRRDDHQRHERKDTEGGCGPFQGQSPRGGEETSLNLERILIMVSIWRLALTQKQNGVLYRQTLWFTGTSKLWRNTIFKSRNCVFNVIIHSETEPVSE